MNPMEITKLSTENRDKYDKLMSFIEKWWEILTIDEFLWEIKRIFILDLTKENLETFRKARELSPKGAVDASKRKSVLMEVPPKLARAVFLENYDMDSFLTVQEQKEADEKYIAEKIRERHEDEMIKYGKTWE